MILDGFVARKILPPGTQVDAAGSATWQGVELYCELSLDPRSGGWDCWTGDLRFRALEAAGYGGVKVKIRPVESRAGWRADPELLVPELKQAVSFARDREDLCEILMHPESLVRGSVEAWQMIANYPARLAQALLIARDLGRDDLDEKVRAAVGEAPATNVYGKQVVAVESVRRWLAEYTRVVGLEVSI
ncbi:hypothetical protein ACIGB8_09065 [Promicromonospora sukumoe]|uniref:hypothetical protein n=1 Tax=Promicromonospora sukumoe TaxID=88382 RepID=UPI0037CCA499